MALAPGRLGFAGAVVAALVAGLLSELTRPTLLLVGNVTVDVFPSATAATSRRLGGAVSYAAAVASALGVRACVVTANGPDADLSLFEGHDLHVVRTDATLTFEHTYTFWGNKRKLRVTAQPNVTLTMEHVPHRCRRARVVLLGPLTPEDLDPSSFVNYRPPLWDRLLGARQHVGLMAQGLQRGLEAGGRVVAVKEPSRQLEAALGPRTSVYLSDVEADVWASGTLEALAARTQVFLVTRGSDGADEYRPGARRRYPVFEVDGVVDTNGAGDSFAAGYILAAAAGHPVPAAVANWAGAMAVSQPQSCKPGCVADAVRTARGSMPQPDAATGPAAGVAASLWLPMERLVGPKLAQMGQALLGKPKSSA